MTFKNDLSKIVFGTSYNSSQASGLCISCKEPALPNCYSEAGRKEFFISGLCEKCFDAMFENQED